MENKETEVLNTLKVLEDTIRKAVDAYTIELTDLAVAKDDSRALDSNLPVSHDLVDQIEAKFNTKFSEDWESNADYRYYEETTVDGHSVFVGTQVRDSNGLVNPSEDIFLYQEGMIKDFVYRLKQGDFENNLVQFEGVYDGNYDLLSEFSDILQESLEDDINIQVKEFLKGLI